MTITQEELKKLLHYDPETGIFKRITRGRGIRKDGYAGCIKTKESGKKYISIKVNGHEIKAHRLAWLYIYGEFPSEGIDHINGNGTDNRIVNLRSVDQKENCKNQRKPSHNKSGVCGVYWDKSRQRWKSQIMLNGKTAFQSYFNNLFDAVCARKNAEVKYGFHKNHGSDRPL